MSEYLTTLKDAIAETVDICCDLVAGSYPKDVFTPLSYEDEAALIAAMRDTAIPNPSERLYAQWARERADVIRRKAATELEDE